MPEDEQRIKVPYFVTNKPWYYENDALKVNSRIRKRPDEEEGDKPDKFKHQRKALDGAEVAYDEPQGGEGIRDEFETANTGTAESDKPKKKRKGLFKRSKKRQVPACDNCGSTRHRTKECLERPHSLKYQYRDHNENEEQEEFVVRKGNEDWDSKRDRWHGYDSHKEYEEQLVAMKQQQAEREEKEKAARTDEQKEIDADELETMRELGLTPTQAAATGSIGATDNPLAADKGKVSARSLDEKASYIADIHIEKHSADEKKAKEEEIAREDDKYVKETEAEKFDLKQFSMDRFETDEEEPEGKEEADTKPSEPAEQVVAPSLAKYL